MAQPLNAETLAARLAQIDHLQQNQQIQITGLNEQVATLSDQLILARAESAEHARRAEVAQKEPRVCFHLIKRLAHLSDPW